MSCGQPHDTDCGEVLARVYEYLDGEITSEQLADIEEHLHECAPCLAEYGLEQVVKDAVHRCCGDETAPASLRTRVVMQIQTLHVQWRGPAAE
jgi:mycothiol system anti-sigma-R factor